MTGLASIPTKTGAELRLIDDGERYEHLGDGTMLVLKMQDPSDLRYAEVFLDPEAKKQLAYELLDEQDLRDMGVGRMAREIDEDLAVEEDKQ